MAKPGGYLEIMTGQFLIDADPERHFLHVTLAGFFTAADTDRFTIDLAAAHARLTCRPNQHVTLCDVGGMKLQPQEIVTTFGSLLANPRWKARRLAFVVDHSLARGQLRRALAGRDAACFDDAASAERWLFARDDGAIAA